MCPLFSPWNKQYCLRYFWFWLLFQFLPWPFALPSVFFCCGLLELAFAGCCACWLPCRCSMLKTCWLCPC
jgi:hypothetical protein